MSTTDETQSGWYESRVAFVTTEFDLAVTFASIAMSSSPGSDKWLRNEHHARTAYESAIHFLSGSGWSSSDAERLVAKKQQIEELLRQLRNYTNLRDDLIPQAFRGREDRFELSLRSDATCESQRKSDLFISPIVSDKAW